MHRKYVLDKDSGKIVCEIDCTDKSSEKDTYSITWKGAIPPLYLRIDNFYRFCGEGDRIPPWYYGLSYDNDYRGMSTFHIIPVNYAVRALRWIGYLWFRIRCRPSYFDAQKRIAYEEGFREGQTHERKHWEHQRDLAWRESQKRGY
jgi:hypothetical protein